MLPIPLSARRVDDENTLDGCELVLFEFIVDFDPNSVALHATANPGDLIVSETGLHLLAQTVTQPVRNYLVNLEAGEAKAQTNQRGTLIRRWSISVPLPQGGKPAVVFTRPGLGQA